MLGWTILFGMMSLGGAAASVAWRPSFLSVVVSVIFAMLFLVSLLTRAFRDRA